MTTIQMNSGLGSTCIVTLPLPSGASVSLVGGIGAVPAEDVEIALRLNWTMLAGQPWPQSKLLRMSIPVSGNWPSNGTITLPDGSTVTTVAGVGKIPVAWVTWCTGFGWTTLST